MPRIKVELPETFSFSTSLDVRVSDLNYGNHVGNDKVLSFLHEGRMRYLRSLGYSEFNMEGVSMIMADAVLVFKNEMYFGDELLISIRPAAFSRIGFDLIYKIEKKTELQLTTTVMAKTAMICFDYGLKKIVPLPQPALTKLSR